MEQIRIEKLNQEKEAAFYALAAEYLPDSEPERMRQYAVHYPDAYLTITFEGAVIGVAFGWDRKIRFPEEDSFELGGIAVRWDHQKKGYGKQLLRAFEHAARGYGSRAISVGSAGGYVEKFYIDCGYRPTEYKVWADGRPAVEKTFSGMEEYRGYQRKNEDGFVVMRKCLL